MDYNIPQKGKVKPIEKQILSTGLVIICNNIQEHKPVGAETDEFTYYTWTEARYSTAEYLAVIDKEKEQQWDAIEYLLKQTGDIPPSI